MDPKWNDELIRRFEKSGINGRKIMEYSEKELRGLVESIKDPEFGEFPKAETNRALEMIKRLKAEREMLEALQKERPIADPLQPLGGGGGGRGKSMAKVKLGRKKFDVDSEEINAGDVSAWDCVALAWRMKSGEMRRLKRLYLVR